MPSLGLEATLRELPPFVCPQHQSPLGFSGGSFRCSDCDHRIDLIAKHADLANGTGETDSATNERVKLAYRFYSMVYPIAALFACWFVWKGSVRKQIHYYRERLREIAAAGEPFVDVATGDGSLIQLALRPLKQKPTLLSVDLSESMLKRAARKLRSVPRRFFYVCDINKTALPIESFSTMLCFGGMHVFSDLPGALANMRRILRGGGTLAGSYLLKPGTPRRDRFSAWATRMGLLSNSHTEDEIDRIFEAAGFDYIDRQLNGRMLLFTLRKPLAAGGRSAAA